MIKRFEPKAVLDWDDYEWSEATDNGVGLFSRDASHENDAFPQLEPLFSVMQPIGKHMPYEPYWDSFATWLKLEHGRAMPAFCGRDF